MKKLLALLLIGTQAFAGFPPTQNKGQYDANYSVFFNHQFPNQSVSSLGGVSSYVDTGNKNLLVNSSFENATYSTGWTITNSTGSVDATNVMDGKQAASLSLSAQTGVVLLQNVTPSLYQLAGQNLEASCKVKTSLSTVQVCGMSNGNVAQCISVPPTNTFSYVSMNMSGPSTGTSIGVEVNVTGSSTGTIVVDDCYVGPSRGVGNLPAQAVLVDAVTVTGCAALWPVTSTTYVGMTAQTGCTYTSVKGIATAPATNIPGFKFASLPAGDYRIEYEGAIQTDTTGASAAFQFTDGTNTAREQSWYTAQTVVLVTSTMSQSFSYSSPQSNVTWQIFGKSVNGTQRISGTTTQPGVFKLWYFPSSQSQVINPNITPASWSGTSTLSGTTTSTSFADPGSVSGSVTQTASRNMSCVANGSGKLGIDCTMPRVGNYMVCYTGSNQDSGIFDVTSQLTDGSGNVVIGAQRASPYAGTAGTPVGGCASYNVSSISSVTTFKVQGKASGGTGTFAPTSFSVVELDAAMPSPVLTGNVTSNSTGAERLERLSLSATCSTSTCTIGSQSGVFASSVTRASTGLYTVNFTSAFSGTPTCVAGWNGSANLYNAYAYSASTSQVSVETVNYFQVNTDLPFNIICMGPR